MFEFELKSTRVAFLYEQPFLNLHVLKVRKFKSPISQDQCYNNWFAKNQILESWC